MPWLLHKFCLLSQAKGLGCQLWKWFCPLGSKDTWHPSHVACNIEHARNTSHRFLTMLSKKDMPYTKPQDVFQWVGGSKFCFLLGRAIVLAMDFFFSACRDLKWIFQTGHPLLQMQFFSVVGLWVRVFLWLKNPLNATRSSASKERGNLCDRAPTPRTGSFSRGAVKNPEVFEMVEKWVPSRLPKLRDKQFGRICCWMNSAVSQICFGGNWTFYW